MTDLGIHAAVFQLWHPMGVIVTIGAKSDSPHALKEEVDEYLKAGWKAEKPPPSDIPEMKPSDTPAQQVAAWKKWIACDPNLDQLNVAWPHMAQVWPEAKEEVRNALSSYAKCVGVAFDKELGRFKRLEPP